MTARAEAKYSITADDRTASVFRKVQGRFAGLSQAASSAGKRSVAAFGGLKTIVGGLLAGAAVSKMASLVEELDDLGKLQAKLGGTVENLSRWRFAADKAGVSSKAFTKAVTKMRISIGAAARMGKGAQFEVFKQLNIDAKKLSEMDFSQQFSLLAQQLKKVKNEAVQVELASLIFGGRGTEMLQLLTQSAAGIAGELAAADRVGAVRTKSDTDLAAAQVDALTDMNVAFRALTENFALKIAPSIIVAADKLTDIAVAFNAYLPEMFRKAKVVGGALEDASNVLPSGPIGNVASALVNSNQNGTGFLEEYFRAQYNDVQKMGASVSRLVDELKSGANRQLDALLGIKANTAKQNVAVAG